MINNEAYRKWAIEHEHEIPRQMNYLAARCPHVTSLERWRIEQEQETFNNPVPVEDVERVNWDDLDL